MKLPNWFKIIWWLIISFTTSIILIMRFNQIISGAHTNLDIFILLLWVILLLCPLFSEISFFGLKVKKELEDLKSTIQFQTSYLQTAIQNKFTVNVSHPSTAIPTKPLDIL